MAVPVPPPARPRPAGGGAARRTVELDRRLHLGLTLGPLRRGRGDLTMVLQGEHAWRASRTPEGPVTLHLHHASPTRLDVEAWGPGAGWAVDHAAELVGEGDDVDGFRRLLEDVDTPERDLLVRLLRTHPGVRLPRSGLVSEALVPSVLEQRVTGQQARRSYRALVRALGEPAPVAGHRGPALHLPPDPARLATTPSWWFHRLDVERRRAETVIRVGRHHRRLDEAAHLPAADATRRLSAVQGVGPWTVAEVVAVALGDADAVSVGDYHLPHQVVFAFTGRPRGSDAEMLELLAPYAGHRGRVARLVALGGPAPPRFGPRQRIVPITHR